MADSPVVAMATKLPVPLRDAFAALAKRRNVTPSALLRRLVEHELAGAPDGDVPGEVETAVRAEVAERIGDVDGARAAAAVNLARRMDRDPTSGAQNAAQLRLLLEQLVPTLAQSTSFDILSWLRLSHQLRQRGYRLTNGPGVELVELPEWERDAIIGGVA
jgi:hypothetical protein